MAHYAMRSPEEPEPAPYLETYLRIAGAHREPKRRLTQQWSAEEHELTRRWEERDLWDELGDFA